MSGLPVGWNNECSKQFREKEKTHRLCFGGCNERRGADVHLVGILLFTMTMPLHGAELYGTILHHEEVICRDGRLRREEHAVGRIFACLGDFQCRLRAPCPVATCGVALHLQVSRRMEVQQHVLQVLVEALCVTGAIADIRSTRGGSLRLDLYSSHSAKGMIVVRNASCAAHSAFTSRMAWA